MVTRTPPQAIEVERSVLGACLTDHHAFLEIRDLITPECFHSPANRVIYETCLESEKPDMLIVESVLQESGKLDEVGGMGYLADLTAVATPRYEEYCQVLIEKKIKRDVILSANEILRSAYNGADAYDLVDSFSRSAGEVGLQSAEKHSLTPSEIAERDKNRPKAEKLTLGVSNLDFGIYGDSFRRGHTMLTIADSGHGKTQWSLFVAEQLLRQGRHVHWFQLEGYDSETSDYIFGTRVSKHDNIKICDNLHDIEEIKREARRVNRKRIQDGVKDGTDVLLFDYVQNIECSQKISKTEKVEYISKHITRLGKELNAVSCPLSQVTIDSNRTGWQQEPRYGDVRWSQQLKQDAALILSVFRPSQIDSLIMNDDQVKNWKGDPVPYGSVFVKQAKVRHGRKDWKRVHMIHTDNGLKPYEPNRVDPF